MIKYVLDREQIEDFEDDMLDTYDIVGSVVNEILDEYVRTGKTKINICLVACEGENVDDEDCQGKTIDILDINVLDVIDDYVDKDILVDLLTTTIDLYNNCKDSKKGYINAKQELLKAINNDISNIEAYKIKFYNKISEGYDAEQLLEILDRYYDNYFGYSVLQGVVLLKDGSWLEREESDAEDVKDMVDYWKLIKRPVIDLKD